MNTNPSIRAALSALLDVLPTTENLTPRLAALRARFTAEPDRHQVCEYLGQITMLVAETRSFAEENRRDHELFLTRLTDKLQQLEKQLQVPSSTMDGPSTGAAGRETSKGDVATSAPPVHSVVQELMGHVTALRQNLVQQGFRSQHDPLTGIANRLGFEQRLRLEYARWKRYASPLVAQMWCVDGFDSIREKYGRQAGDMVLLLVARLMTGNLRETDFVARYENENFVVLLPETLLDDSHVVSERLRKKISVTRFHHQGEAVPVTLSCGYTALQEGDTAPILFQRVQQALARARGAGGGGYRSG